ncbi:hypothetical protein [Chitinophaga barathri]|uniref:DUF3471 domain-containing protein n=1 Tax=Chitinophaga barathri TaxID=1647451 RepID=A0A3N4MFA5_9BACT|nr:hypothetical protein [Chitinophaga barathri]RPD42278.1 hypothetical protein EG028_03620 [Chitinophaga barathri]
MKPTSLLPSGAWQCIALSCLIGALVIGKTSGQAARILPAYHDSIPREQEPDSLKMLRMYTGTYIIPNDPETQIVLENGKLYGIPTSGKKHEMVRTGQHQFIVPEKEILLQFEMDSYGQVAFLRLTRGDETATATKKK